MALLLGVSLVACHKQEQEVVGVAKTAVSAEQKAQAAAAERRPATRWRWRRFRCRPRACMWTCMIAGRGPIRFFQWMQTR